MGDFNTMILFIIQKVFESSIILVDEEEFREIGAKILICLRPKYINIIMQQFKRVKLTTSIIGNRL